MTKVLILGNGFVGASLAQYFKEVNIPVNVVSRNQVDYTKYQILRDFLQTSKPTLLINCSGYTGTPNVDGCETNKELCWFWNVQVPHNIAKVLDVVGIPALFVSSGCIYSGYDKEYTEKDIPNFGFYNKESSYYSQCKHIAEMILTNFNVHILRIRMPFDSSLSQKNYLNKLYNYNKLISQKNSLTSMSDFNKFVYNIMPLIKTLNPGPINVVNPGGLNAKEIVSIFKSHGIVNKNWEFINVENLNVLAKRSNCVLSTEYTKKLGIELPNSTQSLERDIYKFAKCICS